MIQTIKKTNTLLTFLCLLYTLSCTSSPSTHVPIPQEITFQQRGTVLHGDATATIIVPLPANISNPIQINIQQGGNFCSIVRVDPAINKSTIISIEQNGPEIMNTNLQVQIMSSDVSQQDLMIHTLLENGSLLITRFKYSLLDPPSETKMYSFEGIGTTDTWLIDKHQLLYFSPTLYVLKNGELREIIIHEQGYWRMSINITVASIVSIVKTPTYLYAVTITDVRTIDRSKFVKATSIKGAKLIDFAISGKKYFLLDEEKGLKVGLLSQNEDAQVSIQAYNISGIEKVKKMRVHKQVLFLIYELEGRNYLAEYFFETELILNRYYTNFYSIRDIIVTDNYAVVDGYNEFIVLRHSINRNSFEDLRNVEFIYKSHGRKVVNIELMFSLENLILAATYKQRVELLLFNSTTHPNIQTNRSFGINSMFVSCTSDKPHSFTAVISYRGICSSYTLPAQSYFCTSSVSTSFNFQFSHVRKMAQQQNFRFIFVICLIIFVVFAGLVLIGVQRRISKAYQKLKAQQKARKNKIEQHSLNMEQTFNADIRTEKQ